MKATPPFRIAAIIFQNGGGFPPLGQRGSSVVMESEATSIASHMRTLPSLSGASASPSADP